MPQIAWLAHAGGIVLVLYRSVLKHTFHTYKAVHTVGNNIRPAADLSIHVPVVHLAQCRFGRAACSGLCGGDGSAAAPQP